jgi:ribose transport system ATP-binding protein/rhamnose transport system ATP-binding protein
MHKEERRLNSTGANRERVSDAGHHTLELAGVGKSYGSSRALHGIDLDLRSGEVLALFGENGAGKSTLIKIISGIVRQDAGSMTLAGRPYNPTSSAKALQHGVGVITQEFSLCPDLTVAENIVLGAWPNPIHVSRKQILDRVSRYVDELGLSLPLERSVSSLSLGERQLVEIVKAVFRRPQMLLLDEPTAALPRKESNIVLNLVSRLSDGGTGIIIVTHRIDEALGIANSYMVLRNGGISAAGKTGSTTASSIVKAMIGRDVVRSDQRSIAIDSTRAVLELSSWQRHGNPDLKGINLTVHAGEIVGIYGAIGSGADVLASILAGTSRLEAGSITVLGRLYPKSFRNPRQRVRSGLQFVPGDRANLGLALIQSIGTNLLFPPRRVSRDTALFISKQKDEIEAAELIDEYTVICTSGRQRVNSLSGGNQQKVLLASRLSDKSNAQRVVVLHEPTRGVDIGAREAIHGIIRMTVEGGAGALVISSDVDELIELADTIIVLRLGELVAKFESSEVSIENILLASDGSV